ncbi:MAG: hypothetical protein E7457_02905 [Ruminococcaceae bacterium]|nr:hypothetical protein [Oscillospiraceae bacterium]
MRRVMSIFLSASLLMGLMGCTNQGDNTHSGTQTERWAPEDSMPFGDDRSYDSNYGTGDNILGDSYQRMLENARVHDRDGILTDGENSVS